MNFFFCKAYKSYQALRLLWREGFEEDVLVLGRTILEGALQAKYMKEDPKLRARLFMEYNPVMRYPYYQRLKNWVTPSSPRPSKPACKRSQS